MAEIQTPFDLAALRPRLHKVMDFAADQLAKLTTNHPDFFPIYTRNGRWKHDGSLWTDWCAGFLGGQLWLIEEYSGESHWRELAEHYSLLLEYKQNDRDVHDLGFIFLNTYRPWYRRTGAKRLNNVLITAGRTLALRFMENGQYLRSFVAPESLFIDIMMNVPIIFYAAREGGGSAIQDLASAHCRTTRLARFATAWMPLCRYGVENCSCAVRWGSMAMPNMGSNDVMGRGNGQSGGFVGVQWNALPTLQKLFGGK